MAKVGTVWTLSQIVTDLGTRIDDSGDSRWSATQKQLAVQAAVRKSRGRWWESRTDDTNTYDQETFRYTLPPICENVEGLHFEPTSNSLPRPYVSPTRWHLERNTLVFEAPFPKYDGQTLYIDYIVYPANLLSVTAADGVVSSTTLTSATATFSTSGVKPGDEVEISGDTGGPYYVSSVTSNTVLVLHKAPTAGSTLTYYVARYTDLPYEYLINSAMGELYEMSSRNRPGVSVDENIRWATYYRQLADLVLNQQMRHARQMRRY